MPLTNPKIVLASSSPYRKSQLAVLIPRFKTFNPRIDETPYPEENPKTLAMRLARAKASSFISSAEDEIIIGSDQTATCENHLLGKPGDTKNAVEQLQLCSNKLVRFYTALCIKSSSQINVHCTETEVKFRNLSSNEIERYIELEMPVDCAGSFKCEGLGISLFESIRSDDPSALIGLPLIALNRMLRELGINVLSIDRSSE